MTAQSAKESIPTIFLAILVMFSLLITGLNLYLYSKNSKTYYVATDNNRKEISKWKEIARSHPTYRDAHIQLAKLYKRVGNISEAQKHIKIAHKIDPLNNEAKEYANVLGIRSF